MSSSAEVYLKTIAVGYGCAGKTCMLIRYATKKFPTEYIPTVFDDYSLDVGNVKLGLADTGGGEDYHRLRPLSYPGTNVFILCFDVVSRDLFQEIKGYWYPELRHHCPDVPIVLTACKIDLRESEENCVTTKEGKALAAKTNSSYAEISSLKDIGVDELFTTVIKLGKEHKAGGKVTNKSKKCRIF